ncbi:MAG: hypothetical protein NW703_00050 [Nitrospiraceae bacterium]
MITRHVVMAVLGALMATAGLVRFSAPVPAGQAPIVLTMWNMFLFGIPILVIGALLARQRWALMAAVIYGTVGLALDISTLVYVLTHETEGQFYGLAVGLSALLNFLLIAYGGKGFLSVIDSGTLPRDRPPSHPSPF